MQAYYGPRVIMDANYTTTALGDDILMQVTSSDRELLLNLLEYAHRRTSFAVEYYEGGYDIPDDALFDIISANIAELELKLMSDTLTPLFERMAVALECLCNKESNASITNQTWTTLTNDLNEMAMTEGIVSLVDEGDYSQPIDEDRCAIATLVWAQSKEWITEVGLPAMDASIDLLLPLAYAAIAVWMLPLGVALPATTAMAIVWKIADVWVQGRLNNVLNEILSFKTAIICALYNNMDAGYQDAVTAVSLVVDDMNLSPGESVMVKLTMTSWALLTAKNAWDAQTAWAIANAEGCDCSMCYVVANPLCRSTEMCAGWVTSSFICCSGAPGFSGVPDYNLAVSQTAPCPTNLAANINVVGEMKSSLGPGFTVGTWAVDGWDGVEWHVLASSWVNTEAPIREITSIDFTAYAINLTGIVELRFRLVGQAGISGTTDPMGMMVLNYCVTVETI